MIYFRMMLKSTTLQNTVLTSQLLTSYEQQQLEIFETKQIVKHLLAKLHVAKERSQWQRHKALKSSVADMMIKGMKNVSYPLFSN